MEDQVQVNLSVGWYCQTTSWHIVQKLHRRQWQPEIRVLVKYSCSQMQNKEYQQQISTNYLWGGSVFSVKEKYLNLKSKHTYIHIHTYTQVHKHTHTNTECTHPIMYHHTWCLKVSRQGKVTSILLLITVLESLIIKKKRKEVSWNQKERKASQLKRLE